MQGLIVDMGTGHNLCQDCTRNLKGAAAGTRLYYDELDDIIATLRFRGTTG